MWSNTKPCDQDEAFNGEKKCRGYWVAVAWRGETTSLFLVCGCIRVRGTSISSGPKHFPSLKPNLKKRSPRRWWINETVRFTYLDTCWLLLAQFSDVADDVVRLGERKPYFIYKDIKITTKVSSKLITTKSNRVTENRRSKTITIELT